MSMATQERPPTATPSAERPAEDRQPGPASASGARSAAAAGPRYRTLFVVAFRAAVSDADLHRLAGLLNMSTHLHPKLHASPVSPGVSRLDFSSGLFLLRGAAEDEWRLEGRTWGAPAAQTVHRWHLAAADAARLLDPGVPVPPRLEPAAGATATAQGVGRRSRRRRRGWRRL